MTRLEQTDVTVVIPVYNDPLVGRAVRSCLRQTLGSVDVVVVNHGSTDRTVRILKQLARRDRVRVIHLPDNEGGPGRPLNTAIEAARGRYITILGSDDELEPEACRMLIGAAEAWQADITTSLVRRVLVDSGGRMTSWYANLYTERRTFEGIESNPDQMRDQIPVGKLYRRDFLIDNGILFPNDVVYEDQLFMVRAYLTARRFAVIQFPTYRWMVTEKRKNRSITQNRHDIQNFLDRMTVNERIDETVKTLKPQMQPVKDSKFLTHDLKLYLNELALRDSEYQAAFVRRVAPYLRSIDPASIDELPVLARVTAALLMVGDVGRALRAWNGTQRPGRLDTTMVVRDGRVFWCEEHLDTPEGRRWLDVTASGFQLVAPARIDLRPTLTSIEKTPDGTVDCSFEVINQFGTIPERAAVTATVRVQRRRRRVVHDFDAEVVHHDAHRLTVRTQLNLTKLKHNEFPDQTWDVQVVLAWDGIENVSSAGVGRCDLESCSVQVRPPLAFLIGDTLQAELTKFGGLSFRLVRRAAISDRTLELVLGALRPFRRGRFSRVGVWFGRQRNLAVYRTLRFLPPRRGTVMFESFQGRQLSDSPRAVYDVLAERHPELTIYWSHTARRGAFGLPEGTKHVRRGSLTYFRLLARSEYWVDNFGFPRDCRKPKRTTWVQTWHGTPLKTLFFDTPRVQAMPPREAAAYQRLADQWDYLVVPNDYYRGTMVHAINYRNREIRAGLPRNDILASVDADMQEQLKRELGIPLDRRVILYAPTYRTSTPERPSTFVPPDLAELAEALGPEYFLVLRQHYYRRGITIPPDLFWFAANLSGYDEMSHLLAVADVLVTDFSSVAFDFALTGRPIVYYANDYDEYSHAEPGTYFELAEVSPGPVVTTTADLAKTLLNIDEIRRQYDDRYRAFVDQFCRPYDSPHSASETVVRKVWG